MTESTESTESAGGVRYMLTPEEVSELAHLRRWKAEALPVIAGLQELGKVLGLRLGTTITGSEAAEAARTLVADRAADRAAVERVEALADEWGEAWTHNAMKRLPYDEAARCLRAALRGTP